MISAPPARLFDKLAEEYDESFSERLPGKWLRTMVQERIIKLLPQKCRILDIGCGTGTDAIRFAELGHEVVATDLSEVMLQQVDQKLARMTPAVRERVRTATLDAADPDSAALPCSVKLDLVFSNFGALNCVANLQPLFRYVEQKLTPGGYLAITVMGRFCAWETLAFALRGDFRRASRRWRGTGIFRAGSVEQEIWYPSIAAIRRKAGTGLRPMAVYGVGILLPSSEFFAACERWPRFFGQLARVENAIAGWWPANRLGDHFLMVFRKG